jgi:bacteriocin-like protein
MKQLNKSELNNINGGELSGTFISGIIKGVQILLELGRSFGSAIRRFLLRQYC